MKDLLSDALKARQDRAEQMPEYLPRNLRPGRWWVVQLGPGRAEEVRSSTHVGDERIRPPLLAEGGRGAMAGHEGDIVAERP
jgi:hypothetical protein